MRQEISITGTIHDISVRNTASGGQIYRACVAVKEQGRKGEWVDEYPVTLFGSDLNGVTPSEGMAAKVTFFVKPFDWNGKHLVELRGTKVEPVAGGNSGDVGRPVNEIPASAPAASDDEDMPF